MGFSPWSIWSTPIAPQIGVVVDDFRTHEQAAVLKWFKPDLGKKRAVDSYELQLCRHSGPMIVSLATINHNNKDFTKNE